MAGLSGFSHYKEITISHANVDADLSNFPAYVPIINDADIGGRCRADGYDVQFANLDNSAVLTLERLPGFAVTSGQANGDFYVLVPIVAGAADTIIRCYYGKASATDVSSPENTFATANGWVAVWHLEEAEEPYADATGVNNSDTVGVAPTQGAGKTGYGQVFTVATNSIQVPDSASLDIGINDLTISAWMNPAALANWDFVLWHYAWSMGPGYYWRITAAGAIIAIIGDGTDYPYALSADGVLVIGTWTHVTFWCDRDNASGLQWYINGATSGGAGNPTAVGDLTNAVKFWLGGSDTPKYGGTLDEVRISNVLRSAAWIKFEFKNMEEGHAAGNELTWGAETGEAAVYIPKVIMVM